MKLCQAGLVEKGLFGELAARTLLLIARDFTAPMNSAGDGRNLLTPVHLMDFLDQLFGNKTWCGQDRLLFDRAFGETYVNFSHWILT